MMRVLLHGEGVTDFGADNGYGGWDEGPVQIMMRKIINTLDIDCVDKVSIKASRTRLQRSLRGLKGHGAFAMLLAYAAKAQGYDAVALYRDADRESSSDARQEHVCRRRYNQIKDDVYTGFERSRCNLKYVAIIPMKMIENWLLADPCSFVQAYGGKLPQLPPRPELIWGDEENPGSNHPKRVLYRVLSTYGETSNRESYCKIAEYIDVETLKMKCPISFDDFYNQMISIQ